MSRGKGDGYLPGSTTLTGLKWIPRGAGQTAWLLRRGRTFRQDTGLPDAAHDRASHGRFVPVWGAGSGKRPGGVSQLCQAGPAAPTETGRLESSCAV